MALYYLCRRKPWCTNSDRCRTENFIALHNPESSFYAVCQTSAVQQNGIPSTLYADENSLCTILFRACEIFRCSVQSGSEVLVRDAIQVRRVVPGRKNSLHHLCR